MDTVGVGGRPAMVHTGVLEYLVQLAHPGTDGTNGWGIPLHRIRIHCFSFAENGQLYEPPVLIMPSSMGKPPCPFKLTYFRGIINGFTH